MLGVIIFLSLLIQHDLPLPPPVHNQITKTILAAVSEDKKEYDDMMRLAYIESRWNPLAESPAGACGLWQGMPSVWGFDCSSLKTRPIYSATMSLSVSRIMKKRCGNVWLTCYQYGPNHPVSKERLSNARLHLYEDFDVKYYKKVIESGNRCVNILNSATDFVISMMDTAKVFLAGLSGGENI